MLTTLKYQSFKSKYPSQLFIYPNWLLARAKFIFFTLLIIFNGANARDTIRVLDLRYLNQIDLHNHSQVKQLWDIMHATATLQGIVNRNKPQLYIRYIINPSGICVDDYWWNKYRQKGEWLYGHDTLECNLDNIFQSFRHQINGLVVYDSNIASTSNVASTIAGVENLIAIRYDPSPESLYSKLVNLGYVVRQRLVHHDGSPLFTGKGFIPGINIMSTGSTKADPYIWMAEKYLNTGRCNSRYAAYYIDQYWRQEPWRCVSNHHQLTNHDFFVSKKAFFFDLSPWGDEPATDMATQKDTLDVWILKSLLLKAYKQNQGKHFCYIGGFPSWAFKYTRHAGGIHEDVETEWEFSRLISSFNAFKDADAIGLGALANASFWQHFPTHKRYQQHWITHDKLRKKGFLTAEGKVDTTRRYMIFYVGDFDASSWVSQMTPTLWDEKQRGKIPLMWCISPVLSERVPMVLHYYRITAKPNDYFAAADNGAGYLLPGMLQEPRPISGLSEGLNSWAKHCKSYYKKWGLTISGFIIDGNAPALNKKGLDCYASFSPNGIVPQKAPLASMHNNMPILQSDWDITQQDTHQACNLILERMKLRPIPFHWFRAILKPPSWYVNIHDELIKRDSKIEWVDAPTFFELLKIWLKEEKNSINNSYLLKSINREKFTMR